MSATNLQNFSGDVQIRGTTFIKANTATNNLAIGTDAGETAQGTIATAVGRQAGQTSQGTSAVAVGNQAGQTAQAANSVAIGVQSARSNQGARSVAVGYLAAQIGQGTDAVAIGRGAATNSQGQYAVGIGFQAGCRNQGAFAVAIGVNAAMASQGASAVGIGVDAGQSAQGATAIAIGARAGENTQGAAAIAIGEEAGQTNQAANSIILNATGVALNTTTASSFHVKPVRGGNYAASALAYTSGFEIVEETNMHFDDSGNVGIGTDAPDSKLNMKSGVFLAENQASTNGMVLYDDEGGSGGTDNNQYAIGNAKLGVAQFVNDTGTTGSTITLMNKELASNTTKHASIGFVNTDTSGNGKFGGQIGFWPEDNNASKQQFRIYTSGASSGYNLPVQRMVVDGDGNVGIGTTVPESLLHLSASTASANITDPIKLKIHNRRGAGDWSITQPWGLLEFDTNDTGTAGSGPVAGIGCRFEGTNGGDASICFYTDNVVNNDNVLGAANERMCINSDGLVGIGTAAPSDSIHLYKAATDQTTGLLIEKANGGAGSANAFFCVASNSGEATRVSVPKAGIMFERTAQYGLGKLKLCVDSSNDTNPVGVSDSLICLDNNNHVGFGPNLTPTQRFHFQWSTEADHMYMQFGGITHNATSAYWKPYFYTPGNTSNGNFTGATYYSNNMFFGCGQFDVGWGSDYYGGSITIRAGNVRSSGNNGTAASTNYYSGHVYLDGGVSTTGDNTGGTSRTYGGSIIFRCQNSDTTANTDQNLYERMRVDGATGRVGIGATAPTQVLTVQGSMGLGSAASAAGGAFRPAVYWYQTYSGTSGYSRFYLDVNNTFVVEVQGHNKMYLRPDSDLLLNNFTGQHRCIVDDVYSDTAVDYEGLIVCANKNSFTGASFGIKKGCEAITMNESLPDVSLSNVAYDKSCYGVLSASEDPDTREDTYGTITIPIDKEVGDIRMFINSVGEGAIWVINTNGNLESGDYITTSNVVGYGMRQDDDILHNYTVAKIVMDCDFEPVTQAVKQIVKVMGTVNYWVNTTYTDINYEEYSNLTDDMRMTVTQTSYSKEDSTISTDEYNALTSDIQSTYTEMTQIKYSQINKETSKNEIIGENYELEVRQEMVNVLDEHGQLQWEDDPSGATEKAYKIRYLDANGVITDEANAVHTAAFVGCTYHCG